MQVYDNFINGSWVAASTGSRYTIRNPADPARELAAFADASASDASDAVAAAAAAADGWASTPGPERGAALYRLAQLIEEDIDELARIITLEQGKALRESRGEVARAATEMRYMAGEASRPTGHDFPSAQGSVSCTTTAEPLGVVAAICPWNFPVVTPVRKIAPALAWGNTVVLKPSSLTPWSATRLAQIVDRAKLPPGVINVVTGAGGTAGAALVSDARIAGVTFTGSTATGRHIYEQVARRLARVQLELGGKNPAIVVAHDDPDMAAREIVAAAFLCSGQRCTAISRVIVDDAEADTLIARILHHVDRIVVGDGLDSATTMGPLVSAAQLERVDAYVRAGLGAGAELVRGGAPPTRASGGPGHFYAPTVFDRVPRQATIAREEIFGPVLPVIRVQGIGEAIEIANDTDYGLAASVFTSRMDVAYRCAKEVKAGMIHVNHGTASQPHVPFGGVRASGQGAYSIGPTAREFFTTVKALYVRW